MINPDEIRTSKGDCITTKDVFRVQFCDMDVLDNDILGAIGDAKSFTANDTGLSDADDGLVWCHVNGVDTCFVVGNFDSIGSSTCISVVTPRSVVDCILATAPARI